MSHWLPTGFHWLPRVVLTRCEWGHYDYSLRVENLPQAPPPKGQMDLFDEEPD